MGLSVWCCDQAGPFQTIPHSGASWQQEGKAACQPHEYFRDGTAKLLTLFHPADGQLRVEGTMSCTNLVLHGWLRRELGAMLRALPVATAFPTGGWTRSQWDVWQANLTQKPLLPETLPPLRMLLVLDNLAGHKTPDFVGWLFANGIMPLYTPLGGSWLNLAESIQRILKRRALNGQHPTCPEQIMAWFSAVAAHWNRDPTPFVWGGKRAHRRQRQRERRHRLGGSGGYTRTPIRRRSKTTYVGEHDK
jgi:transposase